MPLRRAYQLCPQAIFVEGHMERYREYSGRVFEVLNKFTPLVSMASIDEAYLDMTGTDRLHGPPLRAAHLLHEAIKQATALNCSVGISASRLVAKVSSDQAKPNGVLWVLPGQEAAFLAPLDVRKIPGIGKVTEQNLHKLGIRKVGDMAKLDESFLQSRFGAWGLAMAGKSRGIDAGGWFDTAIGEQADPKSVSHEHTFSVDSAERDLLESTLAHLAERVARRLREHGLWTRTVQVKLRWSDFTTITRAHTLPRATQLDIDLIEAARTLFRDNWKPGTTVRLMGVQASQFDKEEEAAGLLGLLDEGRDQRWKQALNAADRLRDRFGESAVSLGSGLKGRYRDRVQDKPAGLPGTDPAVKEQL